jgi:hypothetical protein
MLSLMSDGQLSLTYVGSSESIYRYSDGLRARRPGLDSPLGQKICFFLKAFRKALGSTQPHKQWTPMSVFTGVEQLGGELTAHFWLVPTPRLGGTILPHQSTSLWRCA